MNTPDIKPTSTTPQTSIGGTGRSEAIFASRDRDDLPRTVIRGESFSTRTRYKRLPSGDSIPIDIPVPLGGVSENAALTDWLNVTFPISDTPECLRKFFHEFNHITGGRFWSVTERTGGLHGWKRSFKFGDTSAMFGIGGQNGTAFLSLPGEACALFTARA